MEDERVTQTSHRHHHLEWWVVGAWFSLALVLTAGVLGAVGLG